MIHGQSLGNIILVAIGALAAGLVMLGMLRARRRGTLRATASPVFGNASNVDAGTPVTSVDVTPGGDVGGPSC